MHIVSQKGTLVPIRVGHRRLLGERYWIVSGGERRISSTKDEGHSTVSLISLDE